MAKVQKKASRKNTPKLKSDSKNVTLSKRKGSDKPFDRTFRTMAEKMPELLIPLINEVFGTDYPLDEEVVQLRNEHQKDKDSITTDSFIRIRNTMYHIECQSVNDHTMAIRMFEYDAMIAIENAVAKEKGIYKVFMPKSCVLYVRANETTPKDHQMVVVFPDGSEHTYKIPCVRCDEYSVEEIFTKKLLFFLPYYMARYQNLKTADEQKVRQILEEVKDISDRLSAVAEDDQKKRLVMDLTKLIVQLSDYIFEKETTIKEGVEDIMLNKPYMLESERLHKEGFTQGELKGRREGFEQGEVQGRHNLIMNALQRGTTPEQLIHLMGISEAEILECQKELEGTK